MVLDKYDARGFNVTIVHGDNEFKMSQLKYYLLPILLYIYGKYKHVDIIERFIRVMKERCRCITHSIPYKYYTKFMVQSLIAGVVKCINALPSKNGIPSTTIQAMIV